MNVRTGVSSLTTSVLKPQQRLAVVKRNVIPKLLFETALEFRGDCLLNDLDIRVRKEVRDGSTCRKTSPYLCSTQRLRTVEWESQVYEPEYHGCRATDLIGSTSWISLIHMLYRSEVPHTGKNNNGTLLTALPVSAYSTSRLIESIVGRDYTPPSTGSD